MDEKRSHTRCDIYGNGKFHGESSINGASFEVVDLSAAGIKLITQTVLNEGEKVHMTLRFNAYAISLNIKVSGIVARKTAGRNGYNYAVQFVNLPELDRIEIDEILKSSCNLGASISH